MITYNIDCNTMQSHGLHEGTTLCRDIDDRRIIPLRDELNQPDNFIEFYKRYKPIFKHCKTREDIIYFLKYFNVRQCYHNILLSTNINNEPTHKLDFNTFNNIIHDLKNKNNREDAYKHVESIIEKNPDQSQINTLTRICNSKPFKAQDSYDKSYYKTSNIETKFCPHCGNICEAPIGTTYIVCGYSGGNDGHDWDGCGHDWCFKCEKKLCKTWEKDHLYVETNRSHNNKCCYIDAIRNKSGYLEEYCQCSIYRNGST